MSQTVPSPAGGDRTTADYLARLPEVKLLNLAVVEVSESGPGIRDIRLTGADLADFTYLPGQDLMFLVDTSGQRIIRRRYTIRRFDRAKRSVDLSVVTDSAGPGARWVWGLRPGDAVEALGPRGKITLAPDVTWHLFIGDDVAVPAISAMVEALPGGARAIAVAEVADAGGESRIEPANGVDLAWTWLHRDGRPGGKVDALLRAAEDVVVPDGNGHGYVFGEATVVSRISSALQARGVPAECISAKAYWGRGRANASHGEPLRDR